MKIFSFFILLILTPITFAEVAIYAIEIPGLHQKDGKGEYDQIINDAIITTGKAKLLVQPPTRAEKGFENCTNCCFSPANKNPQFYEYGDDIAETKPMSTAKIYIFTAPGSNPINKITDLAGKKIGIRNGMPYGKDFDEAKLSTIPVGDIQSNIKKLQNGRLDAFVAYVPDAYAAFESLNIPTFPHDKESPIAVHPDSLVCKGVSPEFIEYFNAQIK